MPPKRKEKWHSAPTNNDLLNDLYASTRSIIHARPKSRMVSPPFPRRARQQAQPQQPQQPPRPQPRPRTSSPSSASGPMTNKPAPKIGIRYDGSGTPIPSQYMSLLSQTLREEQLVAAVNGGTQAFVNSPRPSASERARSRATGPITSRNRSMTVPPQHAKPADASPKKLKLPSSARKKRGEQLNIKLPQPIPKKTTILEEYEQSEEDESDDEEIEWEDVVAETQQENEDDDYEDQDEDSDSDTAIERRRAKFGLAKNETQESSEKQVTLVIPEKDQLQTKSSKRNGPTTSVLPRAEKATRLAIHKIHLICLMAHVALRNHWCNDRRIMSAYRRLLPPSVIDKLAPTKDTLLKVRERYGPSSADLILSRKLMDGLRYAMAAWNGSATHSRRPSDAVRPLHGTGFKTALDRGIKLVSWADINKPDRIVESKMDQEKFVKNLTKRFRGSRDLAAQGFTALLRSIGLDARLVCSLQPLDFTSNVPVEKEGQFSSPANNICSPYPVYWTEVWDPYARHWISVDPIVLQLIEIATLRRKSKLEPPLKDPANSLRYVIAFDPDGRATDITRRYAYWYNAKTNRKRVTVTPEGQVWWARAMALYKRWNLRERDVLEAKEMQDRNEGEELPSKISDFKDHPVYVLERFIRSDQVIEPKIPCGTFALKKSGGSLVTPIFNNLSHTGAAASRAAANATAITTAPPPPNVEYIYPRKFVKQVKSARAWYQQGRVLKLGAAPKKHIVRRTLQSLRQPSCRRRTVGSDDEGNSSSNEENMFDETREDDGKVRVGLYAYDQTELFVPPPIGEDGSVPRNAYGNIDIFVPSMIPKGGVLLTQPHIEVAAKILEVDYARAIVGFEFGNDASFAFKDGNAESSTLRPKKGSVRARAKHGGIVISAECEEAVKMVYDALVEEQEEEDRRRAIAMALFRWRRYITALRIKARLNKEHGTVEEVEEREQEEHAEKIRKLERDAERAVVQKDSAETTNDAPQEGGFFIDDGDSGGGFVQENHGSGDGVLPEEQSESVQEDPGGFVHEDQGRFVHEDQGGFVHEDQGGFVHEDQGGFIPENQEGFIHEHHGGFIQEDQGGFIQEDQGGFVHEDLGGFIQGNHEDGGGFMPDNQNESSQENQGGFVQDDQGGFVQDDQEGGFMPENQNESVQEDQGGFVVDDKTQVDLQMKSDDKQETNSSFSAEESTEEQNKPSSLTFSKISKVTSLPRPTIKIPKFVEITDSDDDSEDDSVTSPAKPIPRIKLVLGNQKSNDIKGKGKPALRESSGEDLTMTEAVAPRGIKWLRQELANKAVATSEYSAKRPALVSDSDSGSDGSDSEDYGLDLAILKSLEDTSAQVKKEPQPVKKKPPVDMTSSDEELEAARLEEEARRERGELDEDEDSLSESQLLDAYDDDDEDYNDDDD